MPSAAGAGTRIGVVGATGAVGKVTLGLMAERGYDDVRAFASARSAGSRNVPESLTRTRNMRSAVSATSTSTAPFAPSR